MRIRCVFNFCMRYWWCHCYITTYTYRYLSCLWTSCYVIVCITAIYRLLTVWQVYVLL